MVMGQLYSISKSRFYNLILNKTFRMSFDFNIKSSNILSGVKVIEVSAFEEIRGTIWTLSGENLDKQLPSNLRFKHDKFSQSKKNAEVSMEIKNLGNNTCISGQIFQVVVDLRKDSTTYLKWESFELNSLEKKLILIPPGMGNAFLSLMIMQSTTINLLEGEYIDAKDQFTVSWNDARLNIDWPINNPILSERDDRNTK